jgi:hypothetical protein
MKGTYRGFWLHVNRYVIHVCNYLQLFGERTGLIEGCDTGYTKELMTGTVLGGVARNMIKHVVICLAIVD